MGLKIVSQQPTPIPFPDPTVLHLTGSITLGDGSLHLRQMLHDYIAAGANRLILNMTEVTHIDSSGIAELVSALIAMKNSGGKLMIFNPTPRVSEMLRLTRIDTVIQILSNAQTTP
jgi:anti-sigma B factor antagonist